MARYSRTYDFDATVRCSQLREWRTYKYSELKSKREDFIDLFQAETMYREKRGDSSLVFVLTYNDEHIRSFYGQNVVEADDLQVFSKSSKFAKNLARKYGVIFDMISVPEYGCGGSTHTKQSVRGYGNNPHFHCVGWFHRCDGMPIDPVQYTLLCKEVRKAWQGTYNGEYGEVYYNDIESYAKDTKARKAGFGFCKIDGKIKNPSSGGSYIAKYIGKDMQGFFIRNMKERFTDSFVHIAVDYLKEIIPDVVEMLGRPPMHYIYAVLLSWLNRVCSDTAIYEPRLQYTHIRSFKYQLEKRLSLHIVKGCTFSESFPAPFWYVNDQDKICEDLTYHFQLFDEEFFNQYAVHHSVKVRHFHGFGYSLLQNSDFHHVSVLDGTYTMIKNGNPIERLLPRCLYRKLYYNAVRVPLSAPTLSGAKYTVVYELNSVGIQCMEYRLRKTISSDKFLVQRVFGSVVSKELLENVEKVSVVYRYIYPYDFNPEKISFADLSSFVEFPFANLQTLARLNCKSFSEDLCVTVDRSPYVSGRLYAAYFVDPLLLDEFDELVNRKRELKENKDHEFIDCWHRVYLSEY